MTVLGVDGWRGGWVAVRLQNGRFREAAVSASLADLLAPADDVVGIDIPLSFAVGSEPRPFDLDARRRLGRRASTLFLVPTREVMSLEPYAAANQLSKDRYGKGISKQVYLLRSKIFEALSLEDPRLVEIHPELVFAELAGGPLEEPKRTWSGQARRRSLLAEQGVVVPDELGAAGRVPPDDLLDAAVVAWAAHRRTQAAVR